MSMTLLLTNNVEERYRGFILSCMPEIAPGVYVSVNLNAAIRERMWIVFEEWYGRLQKGSIIMVFPDKRGTAGICVLSLGQPVKELVDFEGIIVSKKRDI